MLIFLFPDLTFASYHPSWVIGCYGLCWMIAVWRCKSGWLHRTALAFAMTRLPVIVFWVVLGFHLMELWAIGLALATMVIAGIPYILVRPELRERLAGQAKRLLPYLGSSAMVSTRLAKAGASSTVAIVMAIEERRDLARAARFKRQGDTEAVAAVEEGPTKSDHELLIEKYGKYRRGWDPRHDLRRRWNAGHHLAAFQAATVRREPTPVVLRHQDSRLHRFRYLRPPADAGVDAAHRGCRRRWSKPAELPAQPSPSFRLVRNQQHVKRTKFRRGARSDCHSRGFDRKCLCRPRRVPWQRMPHLP